MRAITDLRPDRQVNSPTETAILDAALAVALEVGFTKTTVTEVARRAGVSRMTAYRHFDDSSTLLRALMTREFGRALLDINSAVDDSDPRTPAERVSGLAVHTVRQLATHPLMKKALQVEPQLMMPYIIDHLGSTQRFADAVVTALLQEAKDAGVAEIEDARRTALFLQILGSSIIWSYRIFEDEDAFESALQQWSRIVPVILGIAP